VAAPPSVDAVFPTVPLARGHYESFYLRAVHPIDPLGVWVRYTVHKRPGAPPRGSVWFTLFDAEAGAPLASKVTLDDPQVPPGGYVRIGESAFEPGHATGAARTDGCDASWDLRMEATAPLFRHLPSDWMYRRRLPRTKTESPAPAATFEGSVEVDGRTIAVDGWLGMMGHNWGAQHAERWVWLHGIGFDGHSGSWFDAAVGRVKLGPATTPWIGNGCLHLDGTSYRLGGLERARTTEVEENVEHCEVRLPGDGVTVVVDVGSDPSNFVAWRYADPDGGEHTTTNCSIAYMTLVAHLERDRVVELGTGHGATYELGAREAPSGIAVQPFPDG
jgi:hypothetical protein